MAHKTEYKDYPRFNAIVQYENKTKKSYDDMLKNMNITLSKMMKSFIK